MKLIPIPTYSICQLKVDDEDFEFLSKFSWHLDKDGYASTMVGRKHTKLTNLLLNPPIGKLIDHWDHNLLNVQRSNLRIATQSQNCANRIKSCNTTSKYKGVRWHTTAKRWIAQIGKDRKSIHLGYFKSEEKATKAYNKAALSLFGEFAFINSFAKEGDLSNV